jgi:hypothetical protein
MLSQFIFFSYYYAGEGIIAIWASYSFAGPIFHNISFPAL